MFASATERSKATLDNRCYCLQTSLACGWFHCGIKYKKLVDVKIRDLCDRLEQRFFIIISFRWLAFFIQSDFKAPEHKFTSQHLENPISRFWSESKEIFLNFSLTNSWIWDVASFWSTDEVPFTFISHKICTFYWVSWKSKHSNTNFTINRAAASIRAWILFRSNFTGKICTNSSLLMQGEG